MGLPLKNMGLLLNNFVKNSICFYSTPQEILLFSERSEGANSQKLFIILSLVKRVDPCGLSGVRTWLAPTLFPGFLLPVPTELETGSRGSRTIYILREESVVSQFFFSFTQ